MDIIPDPDPNPPPPTISSTTTTITITTTTTTTTTITTTITITTTTTSQAVNGHVYANKPFRKGEIIEVSRGLLLPEEAMGGAGHIEEFAWFSEVPVGAAPVAQIGIDQNGDPVLVPPGKYLPC